MTDLIFPDATLDALATTMRATTLETFALILAQPVMLARGRARLLVSSVHVPTAAEYETRTDVAVTPTAAFRLPLEQRARRERLSIVYCHSHPNALGLPNFSPIDDEGEKPLASYAAGRVPGVPHVALLVGADGYAARVLGTNDPVSIWSVGRTVTNHSLAGLGQVRDEYDRQIRAFGARGQRAIQSLRVAVVGAGGTGSLTIQQLAYLGVKRYLLIDPDTLTITNLNRVVGATLADIGLPKVAIAERVIRGLVPDAEIECVRGDVLEKGVASKLTDVDFIFCCTDSHGSRFLINQVVHQFYVPAIDMGVVIAVNAGRVTHFGGRVQMLAPGLACLVCNDGILDPQRVRWDLSNAVQQAADPYFSDAIGEPQPAVISLNSSAAGAAITMFLAATAGIPSQARSLIIRGIQGDTRVLSAEPHEGCVNCSKNSYSGVGEGLPLPFKAGA